LNMPDKPAGDLAEVLNSYHIWQRESGSAYSRYLTQGGFTFTDKDRYELIARYREPRCMALQGTTHVQAGMLIDYMVNEKHYFRDRAEFWGFIRKHDMPLYPDHAEVVPAVKKAGGLVFLAHPVNYFLKNDLNRMDELRELLQLDGIECAHSEVPGELTPFYREYCEKHKLLSSAGSDCHSLPGQPYCFCPDCKFGRVPADPKWREEIAERVKIFNA